MKPAEIPATNSTEERERERGQDWFTGSVLEEPSSSVSVNLGDGLVRKKKLTVEVNFYFYLNQVLEAIILEFYELLC